MWPQHFVNLRDKIDIKLPNMLPKYKIKTQLKIKISFIWWVEILS